MAFSSAALQAEKEKELFTQSCSRAIVLVQQQRGDPKQQNPESQTPSGWCQQLSGQQEPRSVSALHCHQHILQHRLLCARWEQQQHVGFGLYGMAQRAASG